MKKGLKTYAILAAVIPLTIYCLTLNSEGGQGRVLVALQSSIVQNHSLAISTNGTDTIQFEGRNYVVYAPGYTFISLPFAEVGFLLDGNDVQFPAFAYITDELVLAIVSSVSALLVYKICTFYSRSRNVAILSALTLAFATSVWPFSVEAYPHALSMTLALLGVYLVLVYSKNNSSAKVLGIAGLALGFATFVEYATTVFVVPLFIYLFVKREKAGSQPLLSQRFFRAMIYFLSNFAVSGIAFNFLYNYALFRDPFLFPQQLYINGLHFYLGEVVPHILFFLISPYRGILFFSPILILGFYGLYRMSRSITFRADGLLYLSLFCSILILYSSWQGWDGGNSYGPRFLILGLPYLVIPISIFLSEKRSIKWRIAFLALFVLSSFIEGIGAISNSLAPISQDMLTYLPVTYILPQILQGKFAAWWVQWFGFTGIPTVEISLASIFVFIWYIVSWLSFENLPHYPKMVSEGLKHSLTRSSRQES